MAERDSARVASGFSRKISHPLESSASRRKPQREVSADVSRLRHRQAPRNRQQVAEGVAIDSRQTHQHERILFVVVGHVVGLGRILP